MSHIHNHENEQKCHNDVDKNKMNSSKHDEKCHCGEQKDGAVKHGEKCSCGEHYKADAAAKCGCGGDEHGHENHCHEPHHGHHNHHHSRHDHHDHHHGHDHCGEACNCGEHGGCGCGCDHENGEKMGFAEILTYIIGGLLLVVAFMGEFSVISPWIGIAVSALVYVVFGKDAWVGAVKGAQKGKIFTEFTLMCVATVGAAALMEFADAAVVMYLYSLGEAIQGIAYRKSKENISDLIDITEEKVSRVEGKSVHRIAASEVAVGDVVNVTLGERISLDGVVVDGNGFADTSAVTGESAPLELVMGTECLAGSVLISGAVSIRVTEPYENSTASKLKRAVERAAQQKAPTEKKISKFAAVFTPCAFAFALLFFVGGWLWLGDAARSLKMALVVLVVSCPCSLVLSVPLAYFSGIGKAAARGIVFRGGEVIDRASSVGTVVFDKTGTLTSSTLDFDGVWMPSDAPLTKQQFLDVSRCALAKSPHAAARSFCEAYEAGVPYRVEHVNNIGGKGLVCAVDGNRAALGNRALMEECGISVKPVKGTAIFVALEGQLCGALMFRSKIKSEVLPEIAKLRRNRVERIAIMSGDTKAAVSEVSDALGISEYYAELKPDEKLDAFDNIYKEEKQKDRHRAVAFCGDGLNDSAAIARADVGIAMGSGSAVTVESADVVVVDDSIARVNDMLSIAKSTTAVANQNIAISLGIKIAVVLIGALVAEPSLELAVVADVGAAVVTVLNAIRAGNIR